MLLLLLLSESGLLLCFSGHSSFGFDACMAHARKAVSKVDKPGECFESWNIR